MSVWRRMLGRCCAVVQEELAVAKSGLRVLIDSDLDGVDVPMAPALAGTKPPDKLQRLDVFGRVIPVRKYCGRWLTIFDLPIPALNR